MADVESGGGGSREKKKKDKTFSDWPIVGLWLLYGLSEMSALPHDTAAEFVIGLIFTAVITAAVATALREIGGRKNMAICWTILFASSSVIHAMGHLKDGDRSHH
jgi:hypothetical protein